MGALHAAQPGERKQHEREEGGAVRGADHGGHLISARGRVFFCGERSRFRRVLQVDAGRLVPVLECSTP